MNSLKSRERIRKGKLRMGIYRDRLVEPVVLTSNDFKQENSNFFLKYNQELGQFEISYDK